MVANGKGLVSTSLRRKTREASEWTGRSPTVRRGAYHPDHAEHILFLQELWARGEMTLVEEYARELRVSGYGAEVVQSILAQGTQGMPGTQEEAA